MAKTENKKLNDSFKCAKKLMSRDLKYILEATLPDRFTSHLNMMRCQTWQKAAFVSVPLKIDRFH